MKKTVLQIIAFTIFMVFVGCSTANVSNVVTPIKKHYTIKEQTGPILKLDPKGHTGLIADIIVTKDGDIISASVDKTIRVWSSESGVEKRKILGQIGSGGEGMIYAIAF